MSSKNSSLTVVGVGIKFFAHITKETESYITNASKLFYLVNQEITKEWLEKVNPTAESLDFLYKIHNVRQKNYQAITEYILESLNKYSNVCVVMYGHPCVYANPALEAAKKAKSLGYDAAILPAVSAEDCLFADLFIDPGTVGCISYEATDMVLYQRSIDIACHVILWQVGFVGSIGLTDNYDNTSYIKVLVDYLLKVYPSEHRVCLYEAAQLPGHSPKIEYIAISELLTATYTPITTLYLPPVISKTYNSTAFSLLNFEN